MDNQQEQLTQEHIRQRRCLEDELETTRKRQAKLTDSHDEYMDIAKRNILITSDYIGVSPHDQQGHCALEDFERDKRLITDSISYMYDELDTKRHALHTKLEDEEDSYRKDYAALDNQTSEGLR
jgi:hypothetical protein